MLVPFALLWPYRQAGFVADDIFFGRLYSPPPLGDLLVQPWPHGMGATVAWRPFALLSWAFSGWWLPIQDPAERHRLFNLLLHGANAWLLCMLARRIAGSRAAGLWAGGLFAIHPIAHESVMWISGRTFPMAALMGQALSIWTLDRGGRSRVYQHAVGVTLLVMALASYEFAVVLPFIVLVAAWCSCVPDGDVGSHRLRAAVAFSVPYWVVLGAYLVFRWAVLTTPGADVLVLARASQWVPVAGIGHRVPTNILAATLRLCVWPWAPTGAALVPGITGAVTTGVVLGSVCWLWLVEGNRRVVVWWLLWIAAWFVPVVASSSFTDWFGYMGAAGVAGLVGGCGLLRGRRDTLRIAWLALVVCMAGLWVTAFRHHAADWVRAGALVEHVVAEAVLLEPGPAEPTDLHFVGVPQREGVALALITYFPNAVWQRYAEPARANARLFVSWESAQRVVSKLIAGPSNRAIRVYEWDPSARTFVRRLERPPSGG